MTTPKVFVSLLFIQNSCQLAPSKNILKHNKGLNKIIIFVETLVLFIAYLNF
ncbi:hypothetical protein FD20_GL000672 [Liquorilactobacillus uvarum DSM 19971]|uniref:Uncharacterized protein n=1 Tax=Liquorilactobacillus uvarum DSM 19971 TaxID=1423812 RepID=A0A0R1PWU6_9LACO|nr:hypothetical protein FD20_GL000672 [Liquorilactobacillus uvarum DSM 19971]